MSEVLALPLSLQGLADMIHKNAADKGFWPETGRNFGEMLMLVTSELAEALEENRDGNPPVWLKHSPFCPLGGDETKDPYMSRLIGGTTVFCGCDPKPEGEAVEIIDAMIRCLDTVFKSLDGTGFSVDKVMTMKMEYNSRRAHKHGKAY